MKSKLLAVTFAVAVVLGACSGGSVKEETTSQENQTQDIKKLVNDYSVRNIEAKSASITSNQLIVTSSDESETEYDLPENEFFISIAPYENQTHP
ncbi:MAG TPA: hypothetical protein DCR24_03715 [Bacillus bacterium]|nr:hypothetical protein [Bacillus sp. (in: firmicutes)]